METKNNKRKQKYYLGKLNLNWADESLKSLEGSKDAFYERKDIYESNHS